MDMGSITHYGFIRYYLRHVTKAIAVSGTDERPMGYRFSIIFRPMVTSPSGRPYFHQ